MERRLLTLADKLGIKNLLEKYPYEVSGGQKQRAAVARAVITQPQLLLADERPELWILRQQRTAKAIYQFESRWTDHPDGNT